MELLIGDSRNQQTERGDLSVHWHKGHHYHGTEDVSEDNTSLLYLSGDVFELNEVLDSMVYRSAANKVGNDQLNISLWNTHDGEGPADLVLTALLSIEIVPRNDVPVISIEGTELELFYGNDSLWEVGVIDSLEDEAVHVGSYFNISDPDLEAGNNLESDGVGFNTESSLQVYDGLSSDHIYVHLSVLNGKLTGKVEKPRWLSSRIMR